MKEPIAKDWPVLSGNYEIGNPESNVAICTISSKLKFPKELFAICGEMRTENLGIERVVTNTISNANIRYIIVCGKESRGHNAGQSLIALHKNGIDKERRIIGSNGAIPYIENIPHDAIKRFQKQIIKIIDMINETDTKKIIHSIKSLPNCEPHEEGYYIVKEIKAKRDDAVREEKIDVMISESLFLDPIEFSVANR